LWIHPPGDRAVALAWRLSEKGLTIPCPDVPIAAIAIHDGVRLYAIDPHFQEITKHTSLLLYRPGNCGSFNEAENGWMNTAGNPAIFRDF